MSPVGEIHPLHDPEICNHIFTSFNHVNETNSACKTKAISADILGSMVTNLSSCISLKLMKE